MEPLHVILGMEPEEYDRALAQGRKTIGWQGIPASKEPRYHSHPALGIIGHSHSRVEDARRPHVHRPEVGWDYTPVFIEDPS